MINVIGLGYIGLPTALMLHPTVWKLWEQTTITNLSLL